MPTDLAEAVADATRRLRATLDESGIQVDDLSALRLMPCLARYDRPYGTRTGTWAEASSFTLGWAEDGRRWVNIEVNRSPDGSVYLCYEVSDPGDALEPLEDGRLPSLNVTGPPRFAARAGTTDLP